MKVRSRLISLLIIALMLTPDVCFADARQDKVEHAQNYEEFTEATSPAKEEGAAFGTMRIKVKEDLNNLEGASSGVCYNGETILKYDTVQETEDAYERISEKYGEDNVIVDLPILESDSDALGWGVGYMNIDDELKRRASSNGQTSAKVTVAVIDSGYRSTHEIFKGKRISTASKDFIDSPYGIEDHDGHGTEVTGLIAEAVPADVELMILKTNDDGSNISLETVGQAVRYAADNEVDVINLSMSTSLKTSYEKYPEMVQNALDDFDQQLKYAADKGVVICASSGNAYGDMDALNPFPANSDYTLAIGAVDKNGIRSEFSNYGSKLDFCAPGQDLVTASKDDDIKYVFPLDSGTSLAAPYITACCAFIKMDDKTANYQQVKETLKTKCLDLGNPGWDKYYGWGMPKYEDYIDSNQGSPGDSTDKSANKAKTINTITVNTKTVNAKTVKNAITKAGESENLITEIVIGKKVRKISKGAFKGTHAKKLTIKSKKLKKKSVKGSLKGSKIGTVQVRIGNTKTNKKYRKKYKMFFSKKNAGKKIIIN